MDINSKVRWKKYQGIRTNQLEFLLMGDVVMTITEKHPKLNIWWKVRGPDGYETWVPEEEIWLLKEST